MKALIIGIVVCIIFSSTHALAETGYLTKNDIEYCEESYEHYKMLGDYKFLEREKRTMESRVCVHLYNDPVWDYSGAGRAQKLLEHGNYYVNVEIAQSDANAKTGTIPQNEKPVSDIQKAINQITALEKKVSDLEKKIAQKDAVIAEQIKVIMNLANKIKSAVFEKQITWFDIF